MKKEEKEQLYNLLSAADNWLAGYRQPEQKMPEFLDDSEISSYEIQAAQCQDRSAPERTGVSADSALFSKSEITAGEFISLEDIAARVRQCTACALAKTRIKAVPGVGSPRPLVLVIGEGPGADEDATGEPFVGRAGKLLDKMLTAIRLSRTTNCFIANIVKCRPPGNRDPAPEESSACAHFIRAQVALLQPKLIMAVGRVAAQNILHTSEGISRIRGRFFDYEGIPLMPTYHPSALLRNEELKRPAWEDLKTFKNRLFELAPGYDTESGGS